MLHRARIMTFVTLVSLLHSVGAGAPAQGQEPAAFDVGLPRRLAESESMVSPVQYQFGELSPGVHQISDQPGQSILPGRGTEADLHPQPAPGQEGYELLPPPGPVSQEVGAPVQVSSHILDAIGNPRGDVARVESSGTWLRNGCWYTQQEFVTLIKARPRRVDLAIDTTTQQVLSTHTSRHSFEPGARVTLGRVMGRDQANREHAWELTFLGFFDFEADASLASASNDTVASLLGPTSATDPFARSDSQSYSNRSRLDSVEFNFMRRTRPRRDALVLRPDGNWVRHAPTGLLRTFMAGLRVVSIDEEFSIISADGANAGTYEVLTHNNMVGLQLGGEIREQFPNWSWGIRGKVGGLINMGDRKSSLVTRESGVTTTRLGEADDETLVFLGEGRGFASYQIRPNLALTCSYDVLFTSGVALASQNLGMGTNFPSFNMQGSGLYHGMSLGFTMFW